MGKIEASKNGQFAEKRYSEDMKKTMLIIIWIILAAISLLYGITIAAIRSGSLFFLFWIALAAVFAFFAFGVRTGLFARWPSPVKIILTLLICAGLVAFIIVEGNIISRFHEQGPDGLDYVIVLGAQVRVDGPSVVLKYRLDKAAEYLERNPDTACIVTGGKGSNEPFSEAEGMAEYLKKKGISPERIIEEPKAETTVQNIEYSMELMEEGKTAGLITNNFHLYRALKIAQAQGMTDVCGIAAESSPLYLPNNMVREAFAMLKLLVI